MLHHPPLCHVVRDTIVAWGLDERGERERGAKLTSKKHFHTMTIKYFFGANFCIFFTLKNMILAHAEKNMTLICQILN
jgi:hypothetical protein